MSLLTTIIALAGPAAAVVPYTCAPDAGTGTSACVSAAPPGYESVDASQSGVGAVHVDASEFSFFGTTYRSVGAFAWSDATGGFTFVNANVFCMSFDGVTCDFLDASAGGFLPTGYTYVGVSSGGDTRTLCYSVGETFGCQSF